MEKIINVWTECDRVYIRTDADNIYSRPIELFPLLNSASKAQRDEFTIELDGQAIRWPSIDEDIHISSFLSTPHETPANPVAEMLGRFPWLNISAVAKEMGLNQSLLAQYIYGIKKPGSERLEQMRSIIHSMGQAMLSV